MTLPDLTSFRDIVHSTVDVIGASSTPVTLTIAQVVEYVKTERNEAFSVFFRGPVSPFMQQGIHRIQHERFGEIEIFLVPVGKTKDGFEYEAAFNYMLNS